MPPTFSFRIQETILLNCSKPVKLTLRDYHTLKCFFPEDFEFPSYGKEQPHHISIVFPQQIQFALCRVQSPLLTASHLISFPAGTKTFQFPAFPILSDQSEDYEDTFRNLWFKAYMRLARALCSLSHPSSAFRA